MTKATPVRVQHECAKRWVRVVLGQGRHRHA